MPRSNTEAVNAAREILSTRISIPSDDAVRLVKQLKRERKFSYARRMLSVVRAQLPDGDPRRVWLGQQHALCTYKDVDLPAERRLDRALELLHEVDVPDSPAAEQETLGLAGAIWKRRWEVTGRKQDLERSLAYYQGGIARGMDADGGYTAVNAAFVLDMLAEEEAKQPPVTPKVSSSATLRRAEARTLRERVVDTLVRLQSGSSGADLARQWWFAATLAEAYFGQENYVAADAVLVEALQGGEYDEWELESTTRQLAALARLQSRGRSLDAMEGSPAWRIVERLVGTDAGGVRASFAGKVGLALSGGGYRASLFHIGVLARLAELDLLRHVEVISCVSGGSILGAHYYLKLKRLLEQVPDGAITREHYVRLVQELERDFLAGIQRNVRMRLFAEFTTNLRMIFERGFTRTVRAGELFEKEIYSRMAGTGRVSDRREWFMSDLLITPAGEGARFHPAQHNWRRNAKVPILVLNATTLNTGHAWQFTASWMGEPPGDIEADIDGNYRLRRLYYDEAPEPYLKGRRVRLGRAVAASAAVPGIFEPVDLPMLYEHAKERGEKRARPITVRLVDGGVHDNQGTTSLTDQECSVQLVSDASGQMSTIDHPKGRPFGVLLRASSVQGARIRNAAYDDLAARRHAGVLRGLLFVHLKRGLGVEHVDWRGCDEPYAQFGDCQPDDPAERADEHRTFYGVYRDMQRHLADLRTDLDSFTDAEAYALMASGYRMTRLDAARASCGLAPLVGTGTEATWAFRAIDPALTEEPASTSAAARLERLLRVACNRAFKIWRLDARLSAIAAVLGAGALVALGLVAWHNRTAGIPLPHLTVGRMAVAFLIVLAGVLGGQGLKRLLALVDYRQSLGQIAGSLVLAAGGFLFARVHLWVFDPLYLRWGAMRHFGAIVASLGDARLPAPTDVRGVAGAPSGGWTSDAERLTPKNERTP